MIFLYPFFLILLIVPFALFFIRQKTGAYTAWKKWIDARLLPFLLVQTTHQPTKKTSFWLLTIVWTLWSLALAGPAVQSVVPAYLNTNSTVIVLDLNSTGRGQQWIKTRAKLSDLLTQLSDEQVALILYDSKGYTITPLTTDKNIIRNMIPTLNANILPTGQNNPETGFQSAEKLLRNIQSNDGRILFITGGGFNPQPLSELIQKSPYQTAVLFIPESAEDSLSLPAPTQIRTADDSDIRALISATLQTANANMDSQLQALSYKNFGIWFVVASIPFILLLFRKNALFLILIACATSADAHLFYRDDQLGYQQTQQAIDAFNNRQYEQAHDLFLNETALNTPYKLSADALYNAANALAYAGKINEAIELYTQVLAQNPTHEDAQFNKEYLEKQIPPQSSQSSNESDESDEEKEKNDNANDENTESQSESNNNEQNNEENESADQNDENGVNSQSDNSQNSNESDNSDSAQNTPSDTQANPEQSDKNPPDEQQNATQSTSADDKIQQQTPAANSESSNEDNPMNTAANDETQQMLNRIQEDPSRLLRNRLYQQYRRQQ